jgi:predicted phosphodiesterase
LLRFAWFSDVQLRQREVKLFSRKISRDLDDVIPTFEHNFVQEDFDWAVFLSLIEATNRLHQDQPLDFMIHTGDGIDAGTIEELYQFIYISNQLTIPWLNAVGNHDIAIFGNYQERLAYTRQAGVNFYPVGNLSNFVWMHRKERVISGFGRHLLPTPSEGGHPPSEDMFPGKKLPPTFHHGFDLALGRTCSEPPPQQLDYDLLAGDYAVDLCATRLPLRLIVLNSVKTAEWGADGRITPAQRNWLRSVLLPDGGGINLVFVHHRPAEFDEQTRGLLAGPGHGALVMFTGHTHQHHLTRHGSPGGTGYYELNNGSVLEFPQVGRLIELRGSPGGSIWLVSRALWSSPMAVTALPPEAEVTASLEACLEQRLAKRQILAESVRCGHFGAYDDYRKNKLHVWGRPQPFDEAWTAANVIVRINR